MHATLGIGLKSVWSSAHYASVIAVTEGREILPQPTANPGCQRNGMSVPPRAFILSAELHSVKSRPFDDEKLSAKRDAVMGIAKTMFASGEAFMEAAGINEKAKMGEDLRRFFLDRGVAWDPPLKKILRIGGGFEDSSVPSLKLSAEALTTFGDRGNGIRRIRRMSSR